MKKRCLVAVLLLCCSLACLGLGSAVVSGTAEKVEVAENLISGSREAAAGLRLTLRNACEGNRLLWETALDFPEGPEAAVSAFRFSAGGEQRVYVSRGAEGLYLWNNLDFSIHFSGAGLDPAELGTSERADFLWDYSRLWTAAAAEVPAGEERTVTLRLRDYYEFYVYQAGFNPGGRLDGSLEQTEGPKVRDFFRIPVPEDQLVTARIKKDALGNIEEFEIQGAGKGTEAQGYLHCAGQASEDCIYFTFDNSGVLSGPADTSQIPGGYGIYRLPYNRDGQGIARLNGEDLALARPLDPEETVVRLALDSLGRLLLFTWREGVLYLNVYLPDTELTPLQRVPLGEYTDWENSLGLRVEDRFLCLDMVTSLIVAELDGGGRWTPALAWKGLKRQELLDHYQTGETAYAWDGARLAILRGFWEEAWWKRGVQVTVYDAGGLAYWGELYTSLNTVPPVEARNTRHYMEEGAPEPFSLAWETRQ